MASISHGLSSLAAYVIFKHPESYEVDDTKVDYTKDYTLGYVVDINIMFFSNCTYVPTAYPNISQP